MDNIIEVKQLPIIEEHLKTLKSAIEEKTSTALKMVCTEDTVKEIKKIRASLTKEFTELETRRKEVKAQLETPYKEFYKVYQDCVSTPFKQADAELKRKVNDVENELKSTKRNKLIDYANELKTAYALDWLNIERILPNVTLSASLTSLKQTVADKLDGINSDCQCISAIGESSLAVLVEYKKSLNLSQAQLIVSQREKEVQKAKSDAEAAKRQEEIKQESEKKVDMLAPPVEEKTEEKIYKVTFTVHGTMSQLKEIKNFMLERGIKYE